MQECLELCIYKVSHLGVCLYEFKRDMSERVHFKVLYFYILQHFTLTGGLGAIKGSVRGRGSTHLSVISHHAPIGDFG